MAAVEAILAAVGLLALMFLLIAVRAQPEQPPAPPPPEDDLAAPYREGLHAAVRLQRSAQDLEQQIWAEAARHGDADISTGSEQ